MLSFSGVYVKFANVSPFSSGFYRVFIGGIILSAITLYNQSILWKNSMVFCIQCLTGFVFAADLYVWHQSILIIGPGLATILSNFQVFFLAGIGIIFLGDKLSLKFCISIPMAITGLFILIAPELSQTTIIHKKGILLGLMTALCYTAYLLLLQKLRSMKEKTPAFSNLAIICLSASFFLFFIIKWQKVSFYIPDAQSLFSLLAYGIFSQVVGWILISVSLPHLRTSSAGLILTLQPALSLVWDIIFFDRPFNMVSTSGGIMTVYAIYLGSTNSNESRQKKTD